jgi:hypothetical protein
MSHLLQRNKSPYNPPAGRKIGKNSLPQGKTLEKRPAFAGKAVLDLFPNADRHRTCEQRIRLDLCPPTVEPTGLFGIL